MIFFFCFPLVFGCRSGSQGNPCIRIFATDKSHSHFVHWYLRSMFIKFRADLQSTFHFSESKALLGCDGRIDLKTLIKAAQEPSRKLLSPFYRWEKSTNHVCRVILDRCKNLRTLPFRGRFTPLVLSRWKNPTGVQVLLFEPVPNL